MGKKLDFTKEEQKQIPELLNVISSILISKLDGGVEAPTLSGTIDVKGENIEVVFEITAKRK